jgi:iron complex transport system ATP-binding protein
VRLKVSDLDFSYSDKQVLKNVSLELYSGEILGIIGPNGSGKSTFLKCINRILQPQTGEILLKGNRINNFSRKELARNIGYVPQSDNRKFPSTVFDTILMGRKPYINWKPKPKDLNIVTGIIDMLELDDIAMRDVNELSGGQRQKVMIGRALAQEPEIMLLDEPTSDLDLKHQLETLNVIEEQAKQGISAIIAIHDLSLAARYSDKVVMLRDGEIFTAGGVEVLTPENIEAVYGVKVSVREHFGRTLVVPEEPIA